MINFRFHVVSLIAIFLALALGVVIGAGVIDRGVVDTLNNRLDSVESKSDRIQSENNTLKGQNDQLQDFIGDSQPFAVSGRLPGNDVGVVAVRGVDGDRVSAVVTATQQADATATGTLWLEDKWNLADADSVKALQDVLGTTTKNKNTLRTEGLQQVAQRLGGADTRASGDQDLLAALEQAGFLGFDAVGNSTITDFPGTGAGIVLVVGNGGSVDPSLVALPAAKALHANEVPLVVASVWDDVTDGPARGDAVKPIRDDELNKTVSTVDDLDLVQGPTTVVLALSDLFVPKPDGPIVGHYGYGDGATQPLPDPVPATAGT
jgi:copper transport outer membrane protein MctB